MKLEHSLTPKIENGLEDTGRGKGKLGQSERVALTYIHFRRATSWLDPHQGERDQFTSYAAVGFSCKC